MKNVAYIIPLIVIIVITSFAKIHGQSISDTECNLTAKEFLKADKDDAILLDVRTQEEFDSGHLEGAILIDYFESNFKNEINKLNKDNKYYVYCKVGGRSSKATKYMIKSGFKNVCNIEGGIIQLSSDGAQLVK